VAHGALPPVYHGYRRAVFMAAVAAIVVLIVTAVVGHAAVGLLVTIGLAMGVWNANRVRESAPAVLDGEAVNRRALGASGLRRLAYITGVVVLLAIAFRPIGWTAVLGLALFQLLLVANTVGPLLREVRRG
jgi:hypothetical protein